MSVLFAMQGNKARTFHGAHSSTPLEITGHWHMEGPQPVADAGGVPGWAADLFDSRPDLMQIALSTKQGGVVWTRPQAEAATRLDDAQRERQIAAGIGWGSGTMPMPGTPKRSAPGWMR